MSRYAVPAHSDSSTPVPGVSEDGFGTPVFRSDATAHDSVDALLTDTGGFVANAASIKVRICLLCERPQLRAMFSAEEADFAFDVVADAFVYLCGRCELECGRPLVFTQHGHSVDVVFMAVADAEFRHRRERT